jgi:hypothetical protein
MIILSGSPSACQVGGGSEVMFYVQSEMGLMEGESISGSDVKAHCDEKRLIRVKEEPPDATGSASSHDEVGQDRLTHGTVKQEVPVSIVLHM